MPFKRAKMVSQVWDSRGVQSELFFDSLGIDDEVFSLYRKIGGIKSVRCRLTRVKVTDCHEQVSLGYEREFLDTGEKTIILDDNLSDGVPHNFESYCVCSASESVVSVPPTQCIARPASTDPSEDAAHALIAQGFSKEIKAANGTVQIIVLTHCSKDFYLYDGAKMSDGDTCFSAISPRKSQLPTESGQLDEGTIINIGSLVRELRGSSGNTYPNSFCVVSISVADGLDINSVVVGVHAAGSVGISRKSAKKLVKVIGQTASAHILETASRALEAENASKGAFQEHPVAAVQARKEALRAKEAERKKKKDSKQKKRFSVVVRHQ